MQGTVLHMCSKIVCVTLVVCVTLGVFPVLLLSIMKLSEALDNGGLTIVPSPGDGHCLLHSVVSSYESQLPHLPLLTIEDLKARIFIETVNHLNEYTSFLVAPLNEPSYMMHQLRVYLESKIYNHDFGDLIPRVIANSLFVSVHILDEIGGEISSKEIEPTVFAQNTLVVHKNGDHYNGVRPVTPRSIPNFSMEATVINKCQLSCS